MRSADRVRATPEFVGKARRHLLGLSISLLYRHNSAFWDPGGAHTLIDALASGEVNQVVA
jgi:hypothetical protein